MTINPANCTIRKKPYFCHFNSNLLLENQWYHNITFKMLPEWGWMFVLCIFVSMFIFICEIIFSFKGTLKKIISLSIIRLKINLMSVFCCPTPNPKNLVDLLMKDYYNVHHLPTHKTCLFLRPFLFNRSLCLEK